MEITLITDDGPWSDPDWPQDTQLQFLTAVAAHWDCSEGRHWCSLYLGPGLLCLMCNYVMYKQVKGKLVYDTFMKETIS